MTKQIQRVEDVFRQTEAVDMFYLILEEASARKCERLIDIAEDGNGHRIRANTPIMQYIARRGTGHDTAGMAAGACWFQDGLHIIRPTAEQYEALTNVSIDLTVEDFSTPFRTVMVELQYSARFCAAVVCTAYDCLTVVLYTRVGDYHITTLVPNNGDPIEKYLNCPADGDSDLYRERNEQPEVILLLPAPDDEEQPSKKPGRKTV